MTDHKICSKCGKSRGIFHRNICLECHGYILTAAKLAEMEATFKPASDYNELLFNLFLTYIRKCKLRPNLGCQAARLKEILELERISPIKSWADIDQLSEKYRIYDNQKIGTGCAFKKIARMLNGLGVLDVSWKDGREGRRQAKIFKMLSPKTSESAEGFISNLAKQNRSQRTASVYLEIILKFEQWLQNLSMGHSAMLARTNDIELYLESRLREKYSPEQSYNHYYCLHKFYRWCVLEKKIMMNPAASIEVSKPGRSIRVCSESDLNYLTDYVKNRDTEPTDALLISLILFWGFTIEQLCLAQISPSNGETLQLILALPRNTYQSRLKRRGHHLDLPSHPVWFLGVQKRYALYWRTKLTEIKHLSVRRPLFIQENKGFNTPIHPCILQRRLQRATKKALGDKTVSWQVLHNTCGVLYTRYDDASLLTKLGWSKSQASNYVHVTKKIHSSLTEL